MRLIFTLEAFNKQNCRIWGAENQKMIIEKPLYPQRVTVWCGFGQEWSLGLICLKIKLEQLFRWMDCAIEQKSDYFSQKARVSYKSKWNL